MTTASDERLLASGDEAGTAPGDRKFRPDVQGLRAVAILLVVLFHIGCPGVSGGYVGVDVFFVISGFVITGVLLREHAANGKTSLVAFYARRARRIIPAATLVIVATVVACCFLLGSVSAETTATDGQWASVFLANFHFAASSTNYLASQLPPSPLQNFWSLAVEEQFYIVYPTIFLIVAYLFTNRSLRLRLGTVLGMCVVGSYVLSIAMTSSNAAGAFFSPFTRAWELALGGLVALASEPLRRLPSQIATAISWAGLGAILVAAFIFTSSTAYPGSLVAIPVLGTALVIAGGTIQPAQGAESILRLRPFQVLGLVSYSWYLWHWPILTIATEAQGKSALPLAQSVLWVLLALVLAFATYVILENPVRHSIWLRSKPWASVVLGLSLVVFGLTVATLVVHREHQATADTVDVSGAPVSPCVSPSQGVVSSLRSIYESGLGSAKLPVGRKVRMLVVGDSTGCSLLPGLEAVGTSYGTRVGNASVLGCGVVSGSIALDFNGVNVFGWSKKCPSAANAAETSAIRQEKPNLILWVSIGETYAIVTPTAAGTEILQPGTAQWTSIMRQRMDTRVQQFLATGARVVILLEPGPAIKGAQNSDQDYERVSQLERDVVAHQTIRVRAVNLASRVCPSGPPCPYEVDGMPVRPDGFHYSLASSLWVAKWLMPQILSEAKGGP